MRRTKGRLEGRWAQSCFQRFAEDNPSTRRREGVADARGLLGFADGSQNIGVDRHELIFTGDEVPDWARGGSYLAVRLIRLKLERWDRLSRTAQERSIGRKKVSGAPLEGRREEEVPKLDERTPIDAHIRMANPRKPGDERHRFLRRPFVYANGFDDYGLLDSGSVFLAFCRDLERQFGTVKRRTHRQDLDEYMVAFGGGYFFCPPGVEGEDDYLARRLVEPAYAAGRQRAASPARTRRSCASELTAPDSNSRSPRPVGPHDEDPGLERVIGEEAPVGRPRHVLRRDRPASAHAPQAPAVRVHHVEVALAHERELGPVRRPGGSQAALARQRPPARPVRPDRRRAGHAPAARSPASSPSRRRSGCASTRRARGRRWWSAGARRGRGPR